VEDVRTQGGVGGQARWCCAGDLDRDCDGLSVVKGAIRLSALLGCSDMISLPAPGSATPSLAPRHDVASLLREQGHEVAAYTWLHRRARNANSARGSVAQRVKALIATSALGMGFDKPDLRLRRAISAHHPRRSLLPAGPGRARTVNREREVSCCPGRGIRRSARYSPRSRSHRRRWCFFFFWGAGATYDALERDRLSRRPNWSRSVDIGRSRLEMVVKVLDVAGAVRRVKGGWVGTGKAWDYEERATGSSTRPQERTEGHARTTRPPTI